MKWILINEDESKDIPGPAGSGAAMCRGIEVGRVLQVIVNV